MRLLRTLRSAFRNPSRREVASPHTLEVVVQWGPEAVLHVAHSSPPRAFFVGDGGDDPGAPAIDFVLDHQTLGAQNMPLALVDGEEVRVLVPRGARVELAVGQGVSRGAELAAQGKLQPVAEPAGARALVLPPGASARVLLGELEFLFTLGASVNASALAPRRDVDWKGQRWTAASLAAHLGCLLLFMLLPPPTSVLALGELGRDSRLVDFVIDARSEQALAPSFDSSLQGGSEAGDRAQGESGAAGTPEQPVQPRRGAARGHAPRPAIPHETIAPDPETAGILGILRGAQLTAPSVFTGERAEGDAVADVFGNVAGATIGMSFGNFGAGMIGVGRGAGGHASGTVGSGGLGTTGVGGFGNGGSGTSGYGYGRDGGALRGPKIHVPHIVAMPADIHGSLSKEVIRRVIHRHLPEVRACYEQRLNARPDLQGRLAVQFVIIGTGIVQVAATKTSDLHDPIVEQCVVNAVRRWIFPQPQGGGVVKVTYPFVMQQM